MLGHSKRGDYAAIFAWTGQMAACFERLKFNNILITRSMVGLFHSFASFCPFITQVLTERLRFMNSSDERRPPPLTSLEKQRFMVERFAIEAAL